MNDQLTLEGFHNLHCSGEITELILVAYPIPLQKVRILPTVPIFDWLQASAHCVRRFHNRFQQRVLNGHEKISNCLPHTQSITPFFYCILVINIVLQNVFDTLKLRSLFTSKHAYYQITTQHIFYVTLVSYKRLKQLSHISFY